uniref:Uncharacterized protein n=1 Tax=Rhizophora mucronata TaxID=61149 RepID=A0A2P2NUT0_RHIMU
MMRSYIGDFSPTFRNSIAYSSSVSLIMDGFCALVCLLPLPFVVVDIM